MLATATGAECRGALCQQFASHPLKTAFFRSVASLLSAMSSVKGYLFMVVVQVL